MGLTSALRRGNAARPAAGSEFGPGGIEVHARYLRIDGVYAATLTLTGYPAEVLPEWLETIYTYPARIDVAIHAEPVAPLAAASRLRKQRARLEAGRRGDADKGRLEDPVAEAAAQDAAELAHRVARSSAKLFKAAIHLTAYARSEDELDAILAEVKGLLAAQLATVTPATFRQLEGWTATLPVGLDRLGPPRTLATEALAACLPIASPDLTRLDENGGGGVAGVLWGLNTATGNPVFWDRWGQQNHNSVVLGASGSGKSYLAKTDLLRELYRGTTVAVIDPEGEYAALAAAVGGTVVPLGTPAARINPLTLPDPATAAPDALARRALDLHALVGVLVGEHDADEARAALDTAALTAYRAAGISPDPRTWSAPAPDLAAVAALLRESSDPAAARLAARVEPFVSGAHGGLFDAPTSHRLDTHLTVYTLGDLPEQLKTAAMLLVLSEVWRQASAGDGARRMVLVDEAWMLMKDPVAAGFLFRLAKSARKHALALSMVTQDAADVLGSQLGAAVVANAATQVLLRQAPQAIDAVADAFHLSAGERAFLLTCPRGNALLTAADGAKATFVSVAEPSADTALHTGIGA
jgi:type IV secretory pathway VirB4 component